MNIHTFVAMLCFTAAPVNANNSTEQSTTEEVHSPALTTGSGKDGGYVYRDTRPSLQGYDIEWDPNGYLFFCLAMGRIGNQMEHFLGSLAFAKTINRTLVLPPIRTYRNVRFTEWFKFEPLVTYHKVILAEDFMDHLAPSHWPPERRVGYCFRPGANSDFKCTLKEGYPFQPFWDGLSVDFVRYDWLDYTYQQPKEFALRYPGSKYPVLALRGAPASFPMDPENWPLQQYLSFSDRVQFEAETFIAENFPDKKFVGLHLRNGEDWKNACVTLKYKPSFMAAPQCLHGTKDVLNEQMCFQTKEEVLRLTRDVVSYTKAKVIFVATDKNPMTADLSDHLKDLEVEVYHMDPHLPLIDQAILIKADHFIGNCVSSFTSFVTRARRVLEKPTSFWGYD